jgi:hypothetical protein
MGLDTHDYGIWLNQCSQYGFTVEQGIYIPAEGFGIRLEDDLVIQESGEPFNLMHSTLKRMKLKVWWTSPKGLLKIKWNSRNLSCFLILIFRKPIFDYGNKNNRWNNTLGASLSVNSAGSSYSLQVLVPSRLVTILHCGFSAAIPCAHFNNA